jgi:hypothetical protein
MNDTSIEGLIYNILTTITKTPLQWKLNIHYFNFLYMLIILYVLVIFLSLILMHFSKMIKKEGYLSISFDLSIMLLLYFWDKQRIAIFLVSLVTLLVIFLTILYFEIIKPSESNFLQQLISQKKETFWDINLTLLCVIIPVCFNSASVMLILLILYLIVNRIRFYKKFKSIVWGKGWQTHPFLIYLSLVLGDSNYIEFICKVPFGNFNKKYRRDSTRCFSYEQFLTAK